MSVINILLKILTGKETMEVPTSLSLRLFSLIEQKRTTAVISYFLLSMLIVILMKARKRTVWTMH
jgi:hypothetical protein